MLIQLRGYWPFVCILLCAGCVHSIHKSWSPLSDSDTVVETAGTEPSAVSPETFAAIMGWGHRKETSLTAHETTVEVTQNVAATSENDNRQLVSLEAPILSEDWVCDAEDDDEEFVDSAPASSVVINTGDRWSLEDARSNLARRRFENLDSTNVSARTAPQEAGFSQPSQLAVEISPPPAPAVGNSAVPSTPSMPEPSIVQDVQSAPHSAILHSGPCQNPYECCGANSPVCLGGCGLFPGVACGACGHCQDLDWDDMRLIPWESLGQGEYIGPARLPHVPEYRLRVDDVVEFVYRLTQTKSLHPYKINVGDTVRIESLTDSNVQRDLIVQPDGTITVRQLGQVPASGRTVDELRADLDERYKVLIRNPSITVTPLIMNSELQELRATVDARAGAGGQSRQSKVTPEGTIQLPAIGSIPAQGLTLNELKSEVEQRYDAIVVGLEITPILIQRAPRFVYVTGEVLQPGRYVLEGPTTLTQAIALAGSWNVGADLHNIVILRRDENWQLMATKLDMHYALFGKEPCPSGEIWLRDSDIVLLPKSPILWTDNLIELFFTRGLYGVFPIQYTAIIGSLSKI